MFTVNRIHKWEENWEQLITEEVNDYITEFYNVADIEELTEEQQEEVVTFVNTELSQWSPLLIGFQNVIGWFDT